MEAKIENIDKLGVFKIVITEKGYYIINTKEIWLSYIFYGFSWLLCHNAVEISRREYELLINKKDDFSIISQIYLWFLSFPFILSRFYTDDLIKIFGKTDDLRILILTTLSLLVIISLDRFVLYKAKQKISKIILLHDKSIYRVIIKPTFLANRIGRALLSCFIYFIIIYMCFYIGLRHQLLYFIFLYFILLLILPIIKAQAYQGQLFYLKEK